MGNSQSQGADSTIDPLRKGFHVLKVRDNSPAFDAGLLSYFHFIVAVNGQSLDADASLFPTTIKASVDQPVLLTVYSARSNDYSELTITPKWWTQNQQDGLIGCSIRYCDYQGALAHVWHVVEVLPNSPAQQAGLVVDSDYIVGTPEIVLREQQDLYALIAARGNEGKPLRLFVYSTVQRAVRDVTLCPRKDWGGEGLIGAELGYGALHKIPVDYDSQYEDTDDEAAHPRAHRVPTPGHAVASPPAQATAASPIHTSPTVMYQPSAAAKTTPAAHTEPSDTSFTVMGQVPSFGAPAHSKYARTLATNLPLGPQEIRPATEYAAMAAPPTDALLAAKRASVDHGQHMHGPQCSHEHDHGHHHSPHPLPQQQQHHSGPAHVHGPQCDHGHEHHYHNDEGARHGHGNHQHGHTSTSSSYVPMPTTTTVPPALGTDSSHHYHHSKTEQLHVLTPPTAPIMAPPTQFSPPASASSAVHDGDVVPLVAADPPVMENGGFAPVSLGRSPSPHKPAVIQQPYAQMEQQVAGYPPLSSVAQTHQHVPVQPQAPSPAYQPRSPLQQPQHHQSPAYPSQQAPRSPSPVHPPPAQTASPPPASSLPPGTASVSPPVQATAAVASPAPFVTGAHTAGPQFISTDPDPDLSAFTSAAPLDLSTFGAQAPAEATATWIPAAAPPVAIPGFHQQSMPRSPSPSQQQHQHVVSHSPQQKASVQSPQQQKTQSQSLPVTSSQPPAFVPPAFVPPATQSPQFSATASKSPSFAPTTTSQPVASAAPSWMPSAAPAMVDMFAPIESNSHAAGFGSPSPQQAAVAPRSPSAAPATTAVPQSPPFAPSPATDKPSSVSPPFSAAAPTTASPAFPGTQVPAGRSPSPPPVAAARSPSPAAAMVAPAARSVSPFTALFGSDPAPDTQSQRQGGHGEILSFIPQSPPQPAAAAAPAPARSLSPQPPASSHVAVGASDTAATATAASNSFVVQPAAMTATMSPVPFFGESSGSSATYQPAMFEAPRPALVPAEPARSLSPVYPSAAAALFGSTGGDSSMSGSHSAALFDTFGVPASALTGNDPFAPVFDNGLHQPPAADASASMAFTHASGPTATSSRVDAQPSTTQAIQDLDAVLDSMSLSGDPQPSAMSAPSTTAAPVSEPGPPAFLPASTSMNAMDFFETLGAATPPMPTSTILPHTPPAAALTAPVTGPSPVTNLFGPHAVTTPPTAANAHAQRATTISPPLRAFSPAQAPPAAAPGSGTSTPPVPASLFGNAPSPPAAALFGGPVAAPTAAVDGVQQVFGAGAGGGASIGMLKSTSAASVGSVGSASGTWNPPPDQGTNPFL